MLSDKSVPETAGNVKQSEIQKSGARNQDRLDVQAVIPRSGFGFRDGLRRQRQPGFLYALHQLVIYLTVFHKLWNCDKGYA